MSPLFSVVMPLYNHERFVAEAISSVLQQSMQDFELIIIDDGSNDNSARVVSQFNDSRISYHYQENQGAHVALNNGCGRARGTYIAILNSDDVFHPDRLQNALNVFNTDEKIGAYFSGYDFIDESSNLTRYSTDILGAFQPLPSSVSEGNAKPLSSSDKWILLLFSGNLFHTTSNLILRHKIFDLIGPFKNWRYVHDYDFFLRVCLKTPIFFDEHSFLQYRFHGHNTLAENSTRSVFETMIVIAEFLSEWQPATSESVTQNELIGLFLHFFEKMRLYGGDRFLLSLILTQLLFRGHKNTKTQFLNTIATEPGVYQSIKSALAESINQDSLSENLTWQKKETDSLWLENQQLKTDLAWQKGETDRWWQQAQQLKTGLTWQKDETEKWWQQAQQLKTDLAWQKDETDRWWQQTQQLKASSLTNIWQKAKEILKQIS